LKSSGAVAPLLTVLWYTPSTGTFSVIGNGQNDPSTGKLRLIIDNAPAFVRDDRWLVPLVTGHSLVTLGNPPDPTQLTFGVFRDYTNRTIDTHQYYSSRLSYSDTRLEWPIFWGVGEFTAKGVSHLTEHYKDRPSPESSTAGITLQFWTDPVEPVRLNYIAGFVSTTYTQAVYDPFRNAMVSVTVAHAPGTTLRYRMHKARFVLEGEIFDDIPISTSEWQDGGDFLLEYTPEDVGFYVIHSLEMEYTYTWTVRLGGAIIDQGTYTGHASPWFTYMVVR
jgi:hypothetical protein